jgi:hypothetical protein
VPLWKLGVSMVRTKLFRDGEEVDTANLPTHLAAPVTQGLEMEPKPVWGVAAGL